MSDYIWPAGIKKTKQREALLRVLESAETPLTAIEIYEQIKKCDSPVWLSTVYRTLDVFTDKGVVLKTTVHNGDMAYYELNRHHHHHYAVCVDCRKIVAIQNCPMSEFKPKLSDRDFRVLGHKVEMYGYCKDCDKRNKI